MARSIFITGGASGIGRAVAQHFGTRGWFVGLADVNETGMAETAALLPGGMSSIHSLDVRDRKNWADALEAFTQKTGGRLDVLFNNAGVARSGQFADCTPDDHDMLMDVNFKGVVYGAEAALPLLKATPGSALINTASAAGLYGGPGMAIYAATKFAVRGMTESLHLEWQPLGIKVASIMPGFIDTPLLDTTSARSNQSVREEVRASGLEFTPVEQVAQTVWKAVHEGTATHYPIGKTAKRLAFMARWAPGLVRRMFLTQGKED